MSGVRSLVVAADEQGLRLDRWFRRHFPGLPHARLEKFLRKGQIRIDGQRAKAGLRLEAGQQIRVPPFEGGTKPPARRTPGPVAASEAKALRARVLYKDDEVLAIDKPAGLAVQGGTKTLRHLDGMLAALSFEKKERPKLVHRLDKDTSGVLVLARSAAAAAWLTEAFRNKTVRKVYWALVCGVPRPEQGEIALPLAKRTAGKGEQVAADDEGKFARTLYAVLDTAGRKVAWLALMPLTGRTHQLRVHCATKETPILGDGKYGGAAARLEGADIAKRLHLHAAEIELPHPRKGRVRIAAPLPEELRASWAAFGFEVPPKTNPFKDV
ncbi:MAG: RluA family pseudouridine synthase [Alphaproteobacteria bacterium]|nr:RluA family pseudouridine synthase [Alphaproteobacteria bacterium]